MTEPATQSPVTGASGSRRRPALYRMHVVMAAASILMGLVLALWGGLTYAKQPSGGRIAMMVAGIVLAAGMGIYMRWFLRKTR